jgi:Aminotransferase class-V
MAFSGHKMYGPMGIGVLAGRRVALARLTPLRFGGDMVRRVTETEADFADLPARLEGGTPNVAGTAGMVAAATSIDRVRRAAVDANVRELRAHAVAGLAVLTSRPVRVERIPDGAPIDLPASTLAQITQALGSSFSLLAQGQLVRLKGSDADARYKVSIRMTLTAPGCGMGEVIADEICDKILAPPRVGEATVDIVFHPPWNRSRISEAAQLTLGL